MSNIQPITINGYSLDSSASVMTSMTTHDSAPMTDLSLVKISRRDGAKITNAQYSEKKITISGQLLLNSITNFDQTADSFKRQVEVQSGNLDIPYASGTRRYNVWTQGVTISRDSENTDYAPYSIDYVAADPPFGMDVTNQTFGSFSNITATPYSNSVYFGGSAAPKPLVNIGVSSGSFLTALQLTTYTPATQIAFSDSAFSTGDQYVFTTNTYQLAKNGTTLDYSGQWPQFTPNQWNGFTISTTGSQGNQIDQQQVVADGNLAIFGGPSLFFAQTFTPAVTANRIQVDFAARQVSPTSNTLVQLRTTSAGKPTGTVLATGTVPITSSTLQFYTATFGTPPTLTAGTQYAYVFSSDINNFWIYGSTGGLYSGGTSYYSSNSGVTWAVLGAGNADAYFRDWYNSGVSATNLNIGFTGSNLWL